MNLARGIRDSGYDVVFVAPKDEKYSNLIREEFECIDVYMNPKGINPKEDFKTILHLKKIYKDIKPNIVLSFTIKPNIYSSLVTGMLGVKSITNITGLGTIFIKQSMVTKIAKGLYKMALKKNSTVFFQNGDDRGLFVENKLVNIENTDLLPGSGVDVEKFSPQDSDVKNSKFTFLLIARLLKDKGVYELIEATKILKDKGLEFDMQILGAVGVENNTAISKDELDIWVSSGYVKYLGTSDNVREVIKDVDCVVLPSYREGTPRSLLEASAMAKPIIATDVVGCKEVVDDNINGYLCEVQNAQDLSEKMEKMLNLSQDELIAMGNNGREKILKEFDEKIVINKYLEKIKKALGK
jgi:glycosyltransferase involved in cell wall biosynthesis